MIKGFTKISREEIPKHIKDKIPGGLSDRMSPQSFDPIQLRKGIEAEMEHTSSREIATEIAMDHLVEDPKYYDKLEKMEGKEEKKHLGPHKLRPQEWENTYHNEEGSDTMLTSLPATFVPAPGGYQGRVASTTLKEGDPVKYKHSHETGTILGYQPKMRGSRKYFPVAVDPTPEEIKEWRQFWGRRKEKPEPQIYWVPEDQLVKLAKKKKKKKPGASADAVLFDALGLAGGVASASRSTGPTPKLRSHEELTLTEFPESPEAQRGTGHGSIYRMFLDDALAGRVDDMRMLWHTLSPESQRILVDKLMDILPSLPDYTKEFIVDQVYQFRSARIRSFVSKKAQYSSETLVEWQKVFSDFEPQGRNVDMDKELPTLWQHLLVAAFEEGGEQLVRMSKDVSDISIIRSIVTADWREPKVSAGYNDQQEKINIFINNAAVDAIKKGNVEFCDYLNSVIAHEWKHFLDDLWKSQEWKKQHWYKEYPSAMPYHQKIIEQSAIQNEIRLAAQQMIEQGYDLKAALQYIPQRLVKQRGWNLTHDLKEQLEETIVRTYERAATAANIKDFTKKAQQQPLTIGIDVDGVLANIHPAFIQMAGEYVPISEEDLKQHHVSDIEHGTKELDAFIQEEALRRRLIANAPVMPGAVEKVNQLYDQGHRIVILTAREESWREQTEEWLGKIGLKYHKLILDKNKGPRAAQEGIDIMIDDRPENIQDVIDHGVKGYVFNQHWNQDVDFAPRFTNWDEFIAEANIKSLSKTAAEFIETGRGPEGALEELEQLFENIKRKLDALIKEVDQRSRTENLATRISRQPTRKEKVPADIVAKIKGLFQEEPVLFKPLRQFVQNAVADWKSRKRPVPYNEIAYIVQTMWNHVDKGAQAVEEQKELQRQEEIEQQQQVSTPQKPRGRVFEKTMIFPPGKYDREKIWGTQGPRGVTEPYYGKNNFIRDVQELVDEIAKVRPVIVIKGWPTGYIGIEYEDKVLLVNELPLRRNVETKQVGRGNAAFIVPQVIDGVGWRDFLKSKSRGDVKDLIRYEKVPGRAYSRHNLQLLEVLFEILDLATKEASIRGFYKTAWYSSESVRDWQKILARAEEQLNGDELATIEVNLAEELPSVWQEAYNILREFYVEQKGQFLEEFHKAFLEGEGYAPWMDKKVPANTMVFVLQPSADLIGEFVNAPQVQGSGDAMDRVISVQLMGQEMPDKVREGDIEFIEMLNAMVIHELTHTFQRKETTTEWPNAFKERTKSYYLYQSENEAVMNEMKYLANQLKLQGYDVEDAQEKAVSTFYSIPGPSKHRDPLVDEQIRSVVRDIYREASIKGFCKAAQTFDPDDPKYEDPDWWKKDTETGEYPQPDEAEVRYNMIDYLLGDYLEKMNRHNRQLVEKEWDPVETFMEFQEGSNTPYFFHHFMEDRGTPQYHEHWELIANIYRRLRGTSEWNEAVNLFNNSVQEQVMLMGEAGREKPPSVEDLEEWFRAHRIKGFTKFSAPRWTTEDKNRLKELYLKYRERGIPHHIIYKAAAELLGRSWKAVKQKLESMYDIDEDLNSFKYEHWDKEKIDNMLQELYQDGAPMNRLGLPAALMYQITNHSLPKAETCGFPMYYNSFDEAIASNILQVGFERDGDKLTENRIETLEDALRYYRRKEKLAHAWLKDEIVSLLSDAHTAGLPLTHSFFKSHPDIYKPLLGVGRSLEGLRDSIRRNGYSWSDLVIEAAPEYVDFYTDDGRLRSSTEEMRIRRFLELNDIPFRIAEKADKIAVEDPELLEQGYKHFVPDFFILDSEGNTQAIVEVFGSVADSEAANTSEIYREKKLAKEKFYDTLPYQFICINNNTDGVDLTDEILKDKFATFLEPVFVSASLVRYAIPKEVQQCIEWQRNKGFTEEEAYAHCEEKYKQRKLKKKEQQRERRRKIREDPDLYEKGKAKRREESRIRREDPERYQKQLKWFREKYRQDSEYREKVQKHNRERYRERMKDPEYREQYNRIYRERQRERMKDPEYRVRRYVLQQNWFKKRLKDPEYKAQHDRRQKMWHHEYYKSSSERRRKIKERYMKWKDYYVPPTKGESPIERNIRLTGMWDRFLEGEPDPMFVEKWADYQDWLRERREERGLKSGENPKVSWEEYFKWDNPLYRPQVDWAEELKKESD